VVRDRGSVTIMNANIEMFEREEVREGLKQIVSEAEALAKTKLSAHNAAEAEKTAAVEEAQRRADGLDWS